MTDGLLLWADIESTGLNPENDLILEIGLRATDLDMRTRFQIDRVVHHSSDVINHVIKNCDDIVRTMHSQNGLFEASIKSTRSLEDVEAELGAWIDYNKLRMMPMCGSSLRLDRAFLAAQVPMLHDMFHYRSIDVSSFKEMCRNYNPDLFAKLPDTTPNHRVRNCLNSSTEELKFYVDNFIFDAR